MRASIAFMLSIAWLSACGSKPAAEPVAPEPEVMTPSAGSQPPVAPEPVPASPEQSTPVAPGGPQCGGFAGIACPAGQECVDDPSDGCDPAHGGHDCGGVCRPSDAQP